MAQNRAGPVFALTEKLGRPWQDNGFIENEAGCLREAALIQFAGIQNMEIERFAEWIVPGGAVGHLHKADRMIFIEPDATDKAGAVFRPRLIRHLFDWKAAPDYVKGPRKFRYWQKMQRHKSPSGSVDHFEFFEIDFALSYLAQGVEVSVGDFVAIIRRQDLRAPTTHCVIGGRGLRDTRHGLLPLNLRYLIETKRERTGSDDKLPQ